MRSSDLRNLVLLLGLGLLAIPVMRARQGQTESPSPVRNPLAGAEIFRHYCATCHGTDGRGHGPASVALKNGAPDLTQISKKNGGVFPFRHVKEIIEGKDAGPIAHGNREMPIWGPIFHEVESDQDLGEVRLDNVTKYLELIQQK